MRSRTASNPSTGFLIASSLAKLLAGRIILKKFGHSLLQVLVVLVRIFLEVDGLACITLQLWTAAILRNQLRLSSNKMDRVSQA